MAHKKQLGWLLIVVILVGLVFVGFLRLASRKDVASRPGHNPWPATSPVEINQPTESDRPGVAMVSSTSKQDIILNTPHPGQVISSPVLIKGLARGNWFFEGSFSVSLVDWDGRIIAEGIAKAQDNWMTNELVPFETSLVFTLDQDIYSRRGALILRKDNPSGLPDNDAALEITIMFQ